MSPRVSRIAALNDQLRTTFCGGEIMITGGVASLDEVNRALVLASVQSFAEFSLENDPYGERDFGAIDLPELEKVFWKIDYYDPKLEFGSEDPSNPGVTRRVLTIMLASEY
ncbi:DUF3768 domain-containing protein [Devosia sp.]|uniref:DUF3768 domain-containing protein n=1 Tax=Devosia sp. TaxID=1871048 RepID=UPI00292FFC8F|nr:DUF3768 domain-containing protein [Devosia sp.]